MDVEAGGGAVVVGIAFAPGGEDKLAFGAGDGGLEAFGGVRGGIDDGFRKVLRLDEVSVAEDDGALDGVFEFTDVAGPVVEAEAAFGVGGEAFDLTAGADGGAAERSSGRGEDVFGALAEGRDAEGDDVEAVVEIFAEARRLRTSAARSRLVAATMRTSTWRVRVPPTRSNSRCLEDAEELGLQAGGDLADFVEEEGAAVGGFEACPFFCATAPVNEPFSWPKSSLSSRVSVRAAQLMATNGLGGARAEAVDGAGDQFLAGAVSPRIRTTVSSGARRATMPSSLWMAMLSPAMPISAASTRSRRRLFSERRRSRSRSDSRAAAARVATAPRASR